MERKIAKRRVQKAWTYKVDIELAHNQYDQPTEQYFATVKRDDQLVWEGFLGDTRTDSVAVVAANALMLACRDGDDDARGGIKKLTQEWAVSKEI